MRDAVAEGIDDLRALKGGYQGQVVIYAVDRYGEHFVARRFKESEKPLKPEYFVYHDGMSDFEKREATYLG